MARERFTFPVRHARIHFDKDESYKPDQRAGDAEYNDFLLEDWLNRVVGSGDSTWTYDADITTLYPATTNTGLTDLDLNNADGPTSVNIGGPVEDFNVQIGNDYSIQLGRDYNLQATRNVSLFATGDVGISWNGTATILDDPAGSDPLVLGGGPNVVCVSATTPVDATITANRWNGSPAFTVWVNQATNELTFRVRYIDGTFKTGVVALT